MRTWLFILITVTICTACGVKGPLYLPENRYPQPGSDTSPSSEPIKQTDPSE